MQYPFFVLYREKGQHYAALSPLATSRSCQNINVKDEEDDIYVEPDHSRHQSNDILPTASSLSLPLHGRKSQQTSAVGSTSGEEVSPHQFTTCQIFGYVCVIHNIIVICNKNCILFMCGNRINIAIRRPSTLKLD